MSQRRLYGRGLWLVQRNLSVAVACIAESPVCRRPISISSCLLTDLVIRLAELNGLYLGDQARPPLLSNHGPTMAYLQTRTDLFQPSFQAVDIGINTLEE